jgi:hydrogenase large subunit
MDGWLNELTVGGTSYTMPAIPKSSPLAGIGLTEAPRGALGHWVSINGTVSPQGRILQYQVVAPTGWNASPMDNAGQKGAIEQALIGTPIGDIQRPVEVLRVIHSFDPCLACSVHMVRPDKEKAEMVLQTGTVW